MNEPTNERLVRIAASAFWRHGYDGTSTRELADELGIKKASLYHHIRGKEDLLHEISVRSLDHIAQATAAAVEQATEPERLSALVRAHVTTALTDRDMHATMLTELRAMSSDRRADVLERRKVYEGFIEDCVGREQQAGRLRADKSPRWLTLALLNLLNWTIFWYDPDGPLDPSEIADGLLDIYLNGAST